jgi:hypothetical protein
MSSVLTEKSASPHTVTNFLDHLTKSIRQGYFTPFLGAGASSLRAKKTPLKAPPWSQIVENLAAIASYLQTKESANFLQSFASDRLGLPKTDLAKVLGLSDDSEGEASGREASEEPNPVFNKNGLLRLQVELIEATVWLTNYFGKRFAQETPSVPGDLGSCRVLFDTTDQIANVGIKQLFKAAAIARDLKSEDTEKCDSPFLLRESSIERNLLIGHIYDKLLTLIAILLGDQRDKYQDDLKHFTLLRDLPELSELWAGDTKDCCRLRLDAVQWMSELVWYTLRYWIPCYPTSAELAFELSIQVDNAPPRRAELPQAAQALENQIDTPENESLSQRIASIITYCEEYQARVPESIKSSKAFYYAIAIAMQHQYDLFEKRSRVVSDPLGDFRTEPKLNSRKPEPDWAPSLVFTTNFDNALEKVFEESDLGFHIVFPTVLGDKDPVWWFRTCYPKTPALDKNWNDIPKMPDGQPEPDTLIGPIIIKLHGAPCRERDKSYKGKDFIVLSEANYLYALASAKNMPDWFSDQLGATKESFRSLWFLGYSISDWNVRLRLYEHCKDHNKGFRGAVDRDADLYRTALLLDENINVEQWVADLHLLPRRIAQMFSKTDFKKSKKVGLLLAKLQQLRQLLEEVE